MTLHWKHNLIASLPVSYLGEEKHLIKCLSFHIPEQAKYIHPRIATIDIALTTAIRARPEDRPLFDTLERSGSDNGIPLQTSFSIQFTIAIWMCLQLRLLLKNISQAFLSDKRSSITGEKMCSLKIHKITHINQYSNRETGSWISCSSFKSCFRNPIRRNFLLY